MNKLTLSKNISGIIGFIKKYVSKNYQWIIVVLIAIITILVSIFVVPWGVYLAQKAETERESRTLNETATYYFTPTMKVETATIKDRAKCWSSNASTRLDAYRCIVDNLIYDPCFYQNTINYVDCPNSPNNHQILIIQEIDANRITDIKPTHQYPWYVILENGSTCRYYTGVTNSIVGGRMDYGCNDEEILSLPINNNEPVQQIKCYKPDQERVEMCKIKDAWY